MTVMDLDERVATLIAAPKSRWVLAWLAARPAEEPRPADFYTASTVRLADTRLHRLRQDPAALLAEVHTRVEDWRYQHTAHLAVDELGPAHGYERIAAALAQAPAAAWWWQPLRRDAQTWICTDPGISQGTGLPFRTGYAHHGDATAPAESLTTSTRLDRLPAVELLTDHNLPRHLRPTPARLSAWAISATDTARIAEIHGPADWTALVNRYPSHRVDHCHAPDLRAQWPEDTLIWSIDWQAMAKDHDAMHLSVAGWLTATSQVLDVPKRGHTFCEGWPTEATRWFRPVFTGPFRPLDTPDLEYGYGRPTTGSSHDLTRTIPTPLPWWQRLLRRHPHLTPGAS